MTKFTIIATLKNGDKWETVRHTKKFLDLVIKQIVEDDDVVKFAVVEEKI